MNFKTLLSALVCVAALSGCANLPPAGYSPDDSTINALKAAGLDAPRIWPIQPEDPRAAVNQISLPGSHLKAPADSLANYMWQAMNSDLANAGYYSQDGYSSLLLELRNNDINTATGRGALTVNLKIVQGNGFVLNKDYTAYTQFDPSIALAPPNEQNPYPGLVKKLLATIYSDPQFIRTLQNRFMHPMVISPSQPQLPQGSSVIGKNVAYVMTDADRGKEVVTPGGGGDKISNYPYRDLEKAIRDALHMVYKDVSVVENQGNLEVLKAHQVSYVFVPEITTQSESSSLFTWPPTKFRIDMTVNVYDRMGKLVTQIRTTGSGEAEYSEFKNNFGLAGSRAADDLTAKLVEEIKHNPKLQ